MTQERVQAWLKAGSALVILAGLTYALAAFPPTAGLAALIDDIAAWPPDGAQAMADAEARQLGGVFGGLMMGWGTMLWLMTTRLYPREPALTRMAILVGLGVWFVVDGVASVVAGAPLNIVLNTVFLAIFAFPLMMAAQSR